MALTARSLLLTELVKKVERGELKPDKSHIAGLRESC